MPESGTTSEQITVLRERVAALDAKVCASEKALTNAKSELDRRLHEMNEFRAQINGERGEFLRIKDYEREHKLTESAIASLRESRAGALGSLTAAGSAVAFIISVATLVILLMRH